MTIRLGVALIAVLATGCLWERSAVTDKRLARLQMGANARSVNMPAPEGPQPIGSLARTAGGSEEPSNTEKMNGVTGNMQFTMRQFGGVYAGGEIEAGPMERHGSYFGAAYGVFGYEARSLGGSVSVEMIAGRQWLRYEGGADDIPVNVVEPRARAQYALGEQVSIGAVIGAGLTGDPGWMGGIYIGVYSEPGK